MLKNNGKIKMQCKKSSLSDLFETLQVNRILQQNFNFLQIPLP